MSERPNAATFLGGLKSVKLRKTKKKNAKKVDSNATIRKAYIESQARAEKRRKAREIHIERKRARDRGEIQRVPDKVADFGHAEIDDDQYFIKSQFVSGSQDAH